MLRGRDFNSYYGNVLELAVSREVVGVGPMILSMSVRLLPSPTTVLKMVQFLQINLHLTRLTLSN